MKSRFHSWLATWLQGRQRARRNAAPTPNAPVITNGTFVWGATTEGFADVTIEFNLDHGAFPVALIEIWVGLDGGAFELMESVSSTETTFTRVEACETEVRFEFKLRYRNGGTVGPFSNVYAVDVQL